MLRDGSSRAPIWRLSPDPRSQPSDRISGCYYAIDQSAVVARSWKWVAVVIHVFHPRFDEKHAQLRTQRDEDRQSRCIEARTLRSRKSR